MSGADFSEIIKKGEIKVRVRRAGMMQFVLLKIRRVDIGREKSVELYTDRMLELSEMTRIAEETGLPVEAENGKVFPAGKGAKDFIGF